jgi:hypothetical protein
VSVEELSDELSAVLSVVFDDVSAGAVVSVVGVEEEPQPMNILATNITINNNAKFLLNKLIPSNVF